MSGTFPTTIAPASVKVDSITPSVSSYSQSGKRYIRKLGGHRWELQCNFSLLNQEQFMEIDSFIATQEVSIGTFQFVSHDLKTPMGDSVGRVPKVSGAGQTGTTIVTSGWGANSTLVLKKGDILKFSGHNKVYKVTADVITSSTDTTTGTTSVPIFPALTKSIADLETVVVYDVPYTVFVNDSNVSYSVEGPLLYSYSLNLREAL